jgi:hypothetical protein
MVIADGLSVPEQRIQSLPSERANAHVAYEVAGMYEKRPWRSSTNP